MTIILRAPHGMELEAHIEPGELGSEGVETTLRQLADTYGRLVATDVKAGLAEPYLGGGGDAEEEASSAAED